MDMKFFQILYHVYIQKIIVLYNQLGYMIKYYLMLFKKCFFVMLSPSG